MIEKKEKVYCIDCKYLSIGHIYQVGGEACLASPLKDGT